jgi:YD repeat-containing protein
MNRTTIAISILLVSFVACRDESTPPPTFRDAPVASARPGAAHPWEGGVPLALGATALARPNAGSLNAATGNLSLRFPVHEWVDRLPGAIVLTYESQAEPERRFRLDVDRRIVETATSVTVEDAEMRPITFARDGGWEWVEWANPDVVDRFAPVAGECCALVARTDPYGNQIGIVHDEDGRLVGVTPAVADPIAIGWDGEQMKTLELPTATATLGWTDGRLTSLTTGVVDGSLVFEYESEGSAPRLARVTMPGGATLDITTASDGTTTRLEAPGDRLDVLYAATDRVELTRTPGATTTMRYSAGGELVAVDDVDGALALVWTDRALTSFTDKLGRTSTMDVDDRGHVVSRSAAGFTATYGWAGDRLSSVSELGVVFTIERNAQGRPTREAWAAGTSAYERVHAWTPTGLLDGSTELGATAQYVWNGDDRLVRVDVNGTTRESYDYDVLGRLVSSTNGRGGTTTYGYANDAALVPSTTSYPSGLVSTIATDVPLTTTLTIQAPGAPAVTSSTSWLADGRVGGQSINGTQVVQYVY